MHCVDLQRHCLVPCERTHGLRALGALDPLPILCYDGPFTGHYALSAGTVRRMIQIFMQAQQLLFCTCLTYLMLCAWPHHDVQRCKRVLTPGRASSIADGNA